LGRTDDHGRCIANTTSDRPTCGGADVDQKLLDATFAQQDGYVVSTEDDLAQSYERLD